jgi:hypothetical protein
LPERIGFGGTQRLAVHRLPGGGRVIDALGRDDADIAWSGIFTGPDASARARLLDGMRVAGAALPLTWDAFYYTVLIERFEAQYAHPTWVPYKLSCTVLRDEAAPVAIATPDLVGSLLADLTVAAVATDTSAAVAAIAASGATNRGTAAYAAADGAVRAASVGLDATIATSGAMLATAEPNTAAGLDRAADTAGTLAAAALASGYVRRAAVNLAAAGT